jgi:hypothetical protein
LVVVSAVCVAVVEKIVAQVKDITNAEEIEKQTMTFCKTAVDKESRFVSFS